MRTAARRHPEQHHSLRCAPVRGSARPSSPAPTQHPALDTSRPQAASVLGLAEAFEECFQAEEERRTEGGAGE